MQRFGDTWIEPEDVCYPSGGMLRRARVFVDRNPHNPTGLPYGELRTVRAGIPDTWFTIPARLRYRGRTVRGFVTLCTVREQLIFIPDADPDACRVCAPGSGCRQ